MAEDDKLKGKTGDELEKAILQKKAGQADQTELKPEQKVEVAKIDVGQDETLDADKYDVDASRTVQAPQTIDAEKFKVERPSGS